MSVLRIPLHRRLRKPFLYYIRRLAIRLTLAADNPSASRLVIASLSGHKCCTYVPSSSQDPEIMTAMTDTCSPEGRRSFELGRQANLKVVAASADPPPT